MTQGTEMKAEDWLGGLRPISVRTHEEAEARATAEHTAYAGRLLRVRLDVLFSGDSVYGNPSKNTGFAGAGLVRVEPPGSPGFFIWRQEKIEPQWQVDVIVHPRKRQQSDAWETVWLYSRAYIVDASMGPLEELAQSLWAPDYREQG
jgi:hypothetical protein